MTHDNESAIPEFEQDNDMAMRASMGAAEDLLNQFIKNRIGEKAFTDHENHEALDDELEQGMSDETIKLLDQQRQDEINERAIEISRRYLEEGVDLQEALSEGKHEAMADYLASSGKESEEFSDAYSEAYTEFEALFNENAAGAFMLNSVGENIFNIGIELNERTFFQVVFRMDNKEYAIEASYLHKIPDTTNGLGYTMEPDPIDIATESLPFGHTIEEIRDLALAVLQKTIVGFRKYV